MTTLENLTKRMIEKGDQELLDMFAKPTDWSSEALDVARAELQTRNIPVPAPPPPPLPLSDGQKRKIRLKTNGWFLLCGGLIGMAIVGNSEIGNMPAVDVFLTGCIVAGLVCLVAGFLVADRPMARAKKKQTAPPPLLAPPPPQPKIQERVPPEINAPKTEHERALAVARALDRKESNQNDRNA